MCIRDRLHVPSPEEFTIRQAWLFDPEMMAYNAGWPLAVSSVSYTHLRAHETVLDLVCRLLLEKKKIYYKQPRMTLHTLKIQSTHKSIPPYDIVIYVI